MNTHRCKSLLAVSLSVLLLATLPVKGISAGWDGNPVVNDIVFSMESFVDINAYQFRPSEDASWQEIENGFRSTGGSLDHNILYTMSDLRLKKEVTDNVNFRMRWSEEEFYESREQQRPLLEIELRPEKWPISFSIIGSPEYAKREADIGLAATLGGRPWNYLHVAWLEPDSYYNEKNVQDDSHYRSETSQLTVEGAYHWGERYKLRVWWQDNKPLEFVLDDEVSVFSYENRSYRTSLAYSVGAEQNYGISLYGFDTKQRLKEGYAFRSQDIRYLSVEGYWFTMVDGVDEWTLGLRYDEFRNDERSSEGQRGTFDFLYKTSQVYTVYHHPFRPHQALEIGLYVGDASRERDYVDNTLEDELRNTIEAKLSTGWQLFSEPGGSVLDVTLSWNLDELDTDPVDGGMMRFSTKF